MNYAGTFGTPFSDDAPVSLTGHHINVDFASVSAAHGSASHDTITIPDAQLLFSSDFSRLGDDLVLSGNGREFVVEDYFHGGKRAFLASPDGASLSGDVVQALTGHVQYAQADPAPSAARDIGQVSKLVGTATVIRNGVLVELHGGDRVFKGDVVQAGASSSCTITFVDGSVFGLSANARMMLNEMVYDQAGTSNSALISLVRGTISFVAGETAKHGDMKVETPVATMGIRGTAVLVEIGFEIPSDGKGPPVNFQVLVEPDGTTGSYILYSNADPSVVIGTIDKSGQIYSVSGNGTFSNLPSPEMSQLAASIVQQVFTQRFQGYVPDKPVPPPQNGSGGGAGSAPATPPDTSIPKLPTAPGDGPEIIPINVQFPDGSGGTKTVTIPVGVGGGNTPPKIVVNDVVTDADHFSFKIADRVTITDPDASDTAVPYVAGSAVFISAVGPANLPGAVHLADLITIDPTNGTVSYNQNAFSFLGQSEQVVIKIEFDSKSGSDTVHETLNVIIDGVNDAPTVTGPLVATAAEGSAAFTANLLLGSSDKDDGETASLSVANLTYKVGSGDASTTLPAGVSLSPDGHTLTVDPANSAFDHLALGEQATIVVSYDVTDVHGASVAQTETITITGINDAPTVAGPLLTTAAEGSAAFTTNLLSGSSDIDDGETASLSVGNLTYKVGSGDASATPPAGVSLSPDGHTLTVDPANSAFDYLAVGEQTTIVVSYDVTDVHGASVAQTETITVTGTDDPPTMTVTENNGPILVPANLTSDNPQTATAAALLAAGHDLVNTYGGATGFGNVALPPGDDNSSSAIDITSVFDDGVNFFGHIYTSFYINNNGNITFSSPSGTFTPTTINAGFDNPIIAAFWADVDTRGGPGMATPGGNSTGSDAVYYALDPVNGVITITWDDVGYYSEHTNNLNAFQIQLINLGNGDFDIVYRYENVDWTTGDASGGSGGLGGTPARAGYSSGDGTNYNELPQSGDQAALLALPTTPGNTGIPGVDIFQVHNGVVGPSLLSATGTITFADKDLSDHPSVSTAFTSYSYQDIHGHDLTATLTPEQQAEIAAVETNLLLTPGGNNTNAGSAAWIYSVSADALAFLPEGAKLTLTYTATVDDHHGGVTTAPVEIEMIGSNDAPIAHADNLIVASSAFDTSNYSTALDIDNGLLLANDTDPDGDALAIHNYPTGAGKGSVTAGDSGTTVYTLNEGGNLPGAGAQSHDSFTYVATDGNLSSAPTQVNLTVVGTNSETHNLAGTTANEIFIGGSGADNFVFAASSGQDTIANFQQGVDKIDLYQITTINADNISTLFSSSGDGHGNTLIHLDLADPTDHNTILVKGVTHLTANDFILHPGGTS